MGFLDNDLKLNKEIVIGFDLTDEFSQVSYGTTEKEEMETFSAIAGGTEYLIPTVLYKRKEVSQWFAGREALKQPQEAGIVVDHLIKKAMETDEIRVGDDIYRPAALIALFMKRMLAAVNLFAPLNRVASVMITVDVLNDRIISVLSEAVKSLGLKTNNVYFQSHMESFYYYTIYQTRELWQHQVLLCDFTTDVVKIFRMECNNNTTPIVAFIDTEVYNSVHTGRIDEILVDSNEAKQLDNALLTKLTQTTEGRIFSSIYFVGEAFRQEIFNESVRFLCHKGRVFEGNNLFSKGAAYSAKNKVVSSILSESHVFLGNDKLKSNVGINVLRRGEPGYLPLLDAGINWFEAEKNCDIYLNQGNKVTLVITPLTGKNPELVDITLSDLPKRPAKTTRLNIDIKMITESKMQVRIKDLGFGELFPSSNTEWNEVINL